MVLDLQSFGAPELFNSANGFDSVEAEAETSLIRAVYLDSKTELAAGTKRLGGELDRATASKLLHLCCKLDSAECASAILAGELGTVPPVNKLDDVSGRSPLHTAASAHASLCVEVLLKKHARTDLRTKDGQGQLALELSLTDTRINPSWDLNTFSVQDLVNHLSEKQFQEYLRTVELLSEKTKEIGDVAYLLAVKGRVASLTALLIVAAEKVNGSVLESRFKNKLTIYECLIREALALGGRTTAATEAENSERRKLLLQEIELLQLFGVVSQSGGGFKKVPSLLIRAAQGGDEDIIQLLLKTNIDVNHADAEGNTALHWLLELSQLLCPQQIRILHLLLQHDALPRQRNKLGMTPFHIAARNGNSEALEVLLLEDPVGVQYKTEMEETPLFFAVMNEGKECAKLLLTWGADGEVLNLRKQRAIDLATSQDMRNILLNPTTVSLINHAYPNQNKYTTSELTDEDTATTTESSQVSMPVNDVNSSAKADVCKYFDSHRGCVRGAKWLYAHREEESQKVKEGVDQSNSCATKLLKHKVFVGGLHPSVDADDLRKFCEEEFGSVEDATVNVTQIENKIQSRGFGFVTFRQEKSASEAMQAQNATMRGKTVEIKGLIPVLGAELEKMSPQREQEQNFQRLQQKSNESIKEGDNPEKGYWADRLVHQQPTLCFTEPQVTKSSPTWLKVFKKWFPGFLKGLSNHPTYPLSSLKEDFRAKFALEMDHSSLGFTKLSDFLKDFSNLCTVEMLPMRKCRTTTHMVLRPRLSSPRCRLLQDLRGTTCISWVLSDCVILAGDSRGSRPNTNELVRDTYSKFREMTPCILTTHAGSSGFEASQTCTYMKLKMSEEILNGTDINSVQNLGKLSEGRVFKDKTVSVEILIGGIQDKVPVCCYFFHKTGLVGSYVVDWKVIGSGAAFVDDIVEAMWEKYGGNTPCSVMVDIIGYLLLIAALRDEKTGGLLSVRTVREAGISIDICLTVVEMMAKFYNTRLSHGEIDDQNKIELPSFKESEDKVIFLVYQRGLSAEVERWLQDDVEGIKEDGQGHMLTELEAQYYAHRVEMTSSAAQEQFLDTAMALPEDKRKLPTPFTIRRIFFRYYELEKNERKYPVFVAGQGLAMLKSLCVSTDMENRRLVED